MKKIFTAALALVLMLAIFTACGTKGTSQSDEPPVVKYNPNPLTGLEADDDYVKNQRPIVFMINNIHNRAPNNALPQYGLATADITYEIVAEGGLTRLLCAYSNFNKLPPEIGSIRSARQPHIEMLIPLNALYMHIGGSTTGRDMLEIYHYKDKEIDGNYQSVRDEAFYFNEARWRSGQNSEHCWFTNPELVKKAIENYNLDTTEQINNAFAFVPYTEQPRVLEGGSATDIKVAFSQSEKIALNYDAALNKYMKSGCYGPTLDGNTGEQVGYENFFLIFAEMNERADSLVEVNYDIGGYGYYFNGGRYEKVRWSKGFPQEPLRIVDMGGNDIDIKINPGKTYVAVVALEQYDFCTFTGEAPAASSTDASASE